MPAPRSGTTVPGISLRQQLLIWLLPASVIILIASILIAYFIAARAAGAAWDQSLHDSAEAFAERVRNRPETPPTELPAGAERVLIADPEDRVWFRLRTRDGTVVSGERQLPELPRARPNQEVVFKDGNFQGKDVRLVALVFETAAGDFELTLGSTMRKRDALIREILLGMIIPELVLFFAMIVLMEMAIERGLFPLKALRDELSARSHLDLRPVTLNEVPDEVHAVVIEINELLERLESSIASQNRFVSDAAHQLRTPIAALQTQAEILLRETAPGEHRTRLERLAAATGRLSHLVRQMLALARAEPSPANLETIDLARLVEDAAETLFPQALAAGIDLGFELQPVSVSGSPLLLQEMIGNLVDNAVRYTPAPGTVTIRCWRAGTEAVVEVEDSGHGIPDSERERIFERFHRLPGAAAEGTGLGLSVVREIARTHGGRVSVGAGKGGIGSVFEIRLPVAAPMPP